MSTDFLFARPRLLFGLARTLDIGGQFDSYNVSKSTTEADVRAVSSDWAVVGQDLRRGTEAFAAQHADQLEDRQLELQLTTP